MNNHFHSSLLFLCIVASAPPPPPPHFPAPKDLDLLSEIDFEESFFVPWIQMRQNCVYRMRCWRIFARFGFRTYFGIGMSIMNFMMRRRHLTRIWGSQLKTEFVIMENSDAKNRILSIPPTHSGKVIQILTNCLSVNKLIYQYDENPPCYPITFKHLQIRQSNYE